MVSILAVTNRKGGVGKTTTVVQLSSYYASKGKKVLIIDMDDQGNTSSFFKPTRSTVVEGKVLEPESIRLLAKIEKKTVNHGLHNLDVSLESIVYNTRFDNLDIVTNDQDSADSMPSTFGETALLRLLNRKTEKKKGTISSYDIVILDCPPSTGPFLMNSFHAANYFICPLTAEEDPFEGLKMTFEKATHVQELNKSLRCLGFVITDFQPNKSKQVNMRNHIQLWCKRNDLPYLGEIRRSETIKSSRTVRIPLFFREDLRGSMNALEDYEKIGLKLEESFSKKKRSGKNQVFPKITNEPALEFFDSALTDSTFY